MNRTQIAIFFITITAMLILVHLVVYQALLAVFAITSHTPIVVLRWVFGILSVSFVGLSILSARYNSFVNRNLYKLSAVWLGFLFYFFLASCIYGISDSLVWFFIKRADLHQFGIALFAAAALAAIYGLVHARKIVTHCIDVKLPNLPDGGRGKKLAFVSDVHLGHAHGVAFAYTVVAAINRLSPDVVFIGGDLYDGVKVDEDSIIEPFKNLKAPSGTYFITGNHDGFSDIATSKDLHAIEKIGIRVLRNEAVDIGGLQLVGIDYKSTASREKFQEVMRNLKIDRSKPSIMLKHVPDNVDIAADAGISLMISGHTHRAQVQPLVFLPRLIYKGFDYGLKTMGEFQQFTSSGVGTWGPPLRVGTNSEIVLIILK